MELLDWIILISTLAFIVLYGIWKNNSHKNIQEYLKGGNEARWWTVGLSVMATQASAITFLSTPGQAYHDGMGFVQFYFGLPFAMVIICLFFLPVYHKLKVFTAYEFLEDRFNYFARAFGSLSFILFQLGRIGIVLLLPALAISIVSGIPVTTSILLMGILCVLYTAFGGIEAVIRTDVIQVVVLMGGSLLAIFWIVFHTETSVTEMIAFASEQNKFTDTVFIGTASIRT